MTARRITRARFNFTLIFSLIFHLVLILGVGFSLTPESKPQKPIQLNITLVEEANQKPVDRADFLAQANNLANNPISEEPKAATQKTVIAPSVTPPQAAVPPKVIAKPDKTVANKASPVQHAKKSTTPTKNQALEPITEPMTEPKPSISASDLILQTQNQIAALEQQLAQSKAAIDNLPKKRFINNTKQYAAAAYLGAWSKKVEKIGNMNYPVEAKKQNLSGRLVLAVNINPDGSIAEEGIVVTRSSGYPILDNAAIKIVRLGAPYAPVPDEVIQGYDVITIVRTWKFETDFGLSK